MKKIGGRIYTHLDYACMLDEHLLRDFSEAYVHFRGFCSSPFNCIRIKPVVNSKAEVAFQYSEDFDTADEPTLTYTLGFKFNGSRYEALTPSFRNNIIWHHKWMWVDPSYTGFDYEASKRRSAIWKPHVSKSELTKIGNKVYWESIKHRWER
jgi:hypothetical protein